MSEHRQRTPFQIYESVLHTLNTSIERIDLIRRDQELLRDGWRIHFAIDPHDINNFCYPFSWETLQSFRTVKIEEISRAQNGRYEVIFNLLPKPYLLEPYEEELQSILSWALSTQYVSNDDDLIDFYLENVEINVGDGFDETKETLTEVTERDISSIIAIVTGIGAIGSKRLSEIVNQRLIRSLPDASAAQRRVRPRPRADVVAKIRDAFRCYFEANERVLTPALAEMNSSLLDRSRRKIERNNQRDARALDELLQLNESYNKQKHLILYFSSSPKSLELDKASGLEHFLPVVDGKPYPLVRTASDLFIYMIYKGDTGDLHERSSVAVERLSGLVDLLKEVESIRDRFKVVSEQCQYCIHDENAMPCEFGSICEGVRETGKHIEQRQYLNVNLSLQKRLAKALEKTQDQSPRNRYRNILRTLSEILSEKDLTRPKDQEMEMVLRTSLNKANFVSFFVATKRKETDKNVSCYLNFYPVCLNVDNPQLKNIFERVIGLLRNDWSDEKFEEIVGEYLKVDAQWNEEPESELVRCFLYLIMDRPKRARRIAKNFVAAGSHVNERTRREFFYLLCFTYWREKNLAQGVKTASDAIEQYRSDGRFSHCRSMIRFSLLEDGKDHTEVFRNVLADTYASIDKFSNENNPLMVAVCYNNAAYYLSDPDLKIVDVQKAEQHLSELTKRIPEDTWEPIYPEFFHTKGCVYYSKFITLRQAESEELLHEAYKAAKKAYALHPQKDQHIRLVDKLMSTYHMLKLATPKENGV
ncbi:MAG: hypothetical protein LC803_08500 [Acidobacteria bacterium]|nr:hypothetical protein [Acidobacteriota bacterium]